MNPKRIVCQGYWVGDLLALDASIVGIEDFYTESSPWASEAAGIEVIEKWEPEHIMALEPELIVTGYEDDYEELKGIAPVVVIPWGTENEERLELIATATGKGDEAGNTLIKEYNQKAEQYKEELRSAGILEKTITVFRNDGVVDGGLEVGSSGIGWGGDVVYGIFNMPMPDSVIENQQDNVVNVSFEAVPELCGDIILVNQGDETLIQELAANPIWQSIPAVQNGDVISIDPGKIFFTDIITQTYKLETISEALLELANR